jgi:hydroxypyruvate isomerase
MIAFPMTLKASVCIDAVLEKMPIDRAVEMVARAGFGAFEFWMWWEKELDTVLRLRDRHSLSIAACCTRFVSLVDPTVRQQYLDGLAESVAVAERLDCKVLISQVGDSRLGIPRDEQHECLVAGLQAAASVLEGSNVVLAIEPLNEQIDHVGYYLVRSDEAFEIVAKVNHPQVKITFDIYHQQISEGNVISNILKNVNHIAHFHAAGNPGRHELTQGELHYPSIFKAIATTNFDGYVGLEYWPIEDPKSGLEQVAGWFAGLQSR